MSTKHTPGPWIVYTETPPYAPGFTPWPLIMAGGPAGRIVANINLESCPDSASAPAFVRMPSEANALLIAASPDFLAAATNAVLLLDKIQRQTDSSVVRELCRDASAPLFAAITKATPAKA